ncbi:MAG TPA: SIR2 family protein [Saprospiraceae bacterium]|nr:SIR2 family protein [Saprospiraceae bacterium]
MKFKELQDQNSAIDFLADHLINGTLVLFLGAGASKGFGLPNWFELINKFRGKVGLCAINNSTTPEIMQNAMDEAIDIIKNDESKKIKIVKEILYPSTNELSVKLAYSSHLLISISSLLIGRKRGHIKRVVTFNYDSMLEWFLSLFGFQVNSINELPALEGSEDVRIYHPHGFVPHPSLDFRESDFLILGLKDANNRIGARNDPWVEKLRQIMETGVCLFVGLSGNSLSDRVIAPILSTTGDFFKDERPLGIWIYKDKLTDDKQKEYFRNNIIPIEMLEDSEISEFLLKISQNALEKRK